VCFHYIGFSSEYDEWLPENSPRVLSHELPPRPVDDISAARRTGSALPAPPAKHQRTDGGVAARKPVSGTPPSAPAEPPTGVLADASLQRRVGGKVGEELMWDLLAPVPTPAGLGFCQRVSTDL
jgi:hypothetical protein